MSEKDNNTTPDKNSLGNATPSHTTPPKSQPSEPYNLEPTPQGEQPITPKPQPPKHNNSTQQWDSVIELLLWFSSVEEGMPTPSVGIANISLAKTKSLLQPIQFYFSDLESYQLVYRFSFAHYIVTSRIWADNPYFSKYKLSKANNQIIQSSADGSSSASAFMFKSIQEGDFLMSDLLSTPYGSYVYQTLEQIKHLVVSL
ncbi:hypothetical protein BGL87_08330 [Helicobacter pylori]|uniref:hypothetical protein n=1 Tax=Helicobacter pylori TaxID=210 RepID=UPI0009A46232|nr:hypothetical protein [Helicobacter pylori]OPG60910.1 hypothetical protein BGL87_08330 [Helicobacter pylori]